MKLSVTEQRRLQMRGPAVVYESAQAAVDGIGHGEVQPGDVVVVRGLGAGLAGKVAVVTDGQLSGLTNVGITLGEVQPEAAAGGPIGLVQHGDVISIDVQARVADLDVAEHVLAERRRDHPWRPQAEPEHGWLAIYSRLVRPRREGAILER